MFKRILFECTPALDKNGGAFYPELKIPNDIQWSAADLGAINKFLEDNRDDPDSRVLDFETTTHGLIKVSFEVPTRKTGGQLERASRIVGFLESSQDENAKVSSDSILGPDCTVTSTVIARRFYVMTRDGHYAEYEAAKYIRTEKYITFVDSVGVEVGFVKMKDVLTTSNIRTIAVSEIAQPIQ